MKRSILLALTAFIIGSLSTAWGADPDLLVSYTFREGAGDTIRDVSGNGDPLDLVIEEPANVRWLPDGGLVFEDVDLAKTEGPATKIIDACKISNEITIIAWIKPANLELKGPARTITCSANPSNRNFTLGQDTTGYQIRLRTTVTGNNGYNPPVRVPDSVVLDKISKIAYTRDNAGEAKFYINGEHVAGDTDTIPGDMTNWDDSYQLGIGHELDRADDLGRMWLGEYHFLAVYSRALTQDEINGLAGAPVEPQNKLASTWGEIKALR